MIRHACLKAENTFPLNSCLRRPWRAAHDRAYASMVTRDDGSNFCCEPGSFSHHLLILTKVQNITEPDPPSLFEVLCEILLPPGHWLHPACVCIRRKGGWRVGFPYNLPHHPPLTKSHTDTSARPQVVLAEGGSRWTCYLEDFRQIRCRDKSIKAFCGQSPLLWVLAQQEKHPQSFIYKVVHEFLLRIWKLERWQQFWWKMRWIARS